MEGYDESTYGDSIAEIYDELYADYDPSAVDLLQELAGQGRILELGIGTGRIAIPLHQRGLRVAGLDASKAMLDRLQAKSDSAGIETRLGNFLDFEWGGRFDLIYIAFNTFFNLSAQEQQINCFRNTARHLTSHGLFLVEAFVPDMARFDNNQTVRLIKLSADKVQFEVSRHYPVEQQVHSQIVLLSDGVVNMHPIKLRYVWPSEMDLMARLAGLQLKHRWGSWDKSEYSVESVKHISLYGMDHQVEG